MDKYIIHKHSTRKCAGFEFKLFDIFFISPQKHMLWVLIRSVLAKRF